MGTIAALIIIAVVTCSLLIYNLDTVYPGVTVNGTDLYGLDSAEAAAAVGTKDISVTVSMPNGDSFVINAADVGVSVAAEDLVTLAMAQGRDGNIINRVISYINAYSNPVEIMTLVKNTVAPEAVKAAVTPYVDAYNTAVGGAPYEVSGSKLIIRKGAGQMGTDADTITNLVMASLNTAFDTGSAQSTEFTLTDVKEMSIQDIYNGVFIAPANAAYDPATGGIFPSVTGVSFDVPSAKSAYEKAALGETVTVDLIFTEPEIIAQNADELLYRDVLHSVSTYLTSFYNRTNNIRLAAAAINGFILEPGETFSFNDTVGQRTKAKGYLEATSYIGGKSVPDVGGGICQVSSSLYCCAVYSDLEIVDRSNHMFPVAYLPLGIDATVNWGTCDFKFKNDTDFPIMIEAYIDEDAYDLVVTFHGTKLDDRYAKCTYQIVDVYNFKTIEKEDPKIPQGKTEVETEGVTGYLVYTYRSWYDGNDELIETEFLASSDYDKRDKVVLIPVPLPEPEPAPEPEQPAE